MKLNNSRRQVDWVEVLCDVAILLCNIQMIQSLIFIDLKLFEILIIKSLFTFAVIIIYIIIYDKQNYVKNLLFYNSAYLFYHQIIEYLCDFMTTIFITLIGLF